MENSDGLQLSPAQTANSHTSIPKSPFAVRMPFYCNVGVEVYSADTKGRLYSPCNFKWKRVDFDEERKRWARYFRINRELFLRLPRSTTDAALGSYFDNKDRYEVEITINYSRRSEPDPIADSTKFADPNNRSDVILTIGEEKVHVSKELLAIYSPFFEILFFGDYAEKGKEEVKIEDVEYEEFLDILRIIYFRADITDRTLPHILKLADRFQIESLLRKSEKYLLQSKTFTRDEKGRFADQYRFSALREFLDVLEIIYIRAWITDRNLPHILKLPAIFQIESLRTSNMPIHLNAFTYDEICRFAPELRDYCYRKWDDEDASHTLKKLTPMNFSSPNNRNDVILKIGEEKLHVSKEVLAIHSPVFEDLIFGKKPEKGKDEVEIKDVVYEEFIDLLHVIYAHADITDSTILHILKLSGRFKMERALNKSEKCLKKVKGFDVMKKLLLADQYKFSGVKDHFLQRCSSVRETAKLRYSPEFVTLSVATRAAIWDRERKLEGR